MRWFTDDLPGTGGLLKSEPADFVVEELPAYPPSGQGDHLFLTIEKTGLSTPEAVRRVARALGIDPDDVGVAGLKDRQAVTRQTISVPATDPVQAVNLELEGIRVLSGARHFHKLRTGHLRGNRFTITLRGVVADAEARAREILARLITTWLPNRFGAQRFGRRGDNPVEGKAVLLGGRDEPDRQRRRFLISAYQSALFNRYLEWRIGEGLLHRVMVGDVMQRVDSGGLFTCDPTDLLYNQARLEMRHIVSTGPMFGWKMFATTPGSPAAAVEQRLLDEEGFDLEIFRPLGKLALGARRPLLVRLEGAYARQNGDSLVVGFSLPAGAYATVLLEEVMKPGESILHPADG